MSYDFLLTFEKKQKKHTEKARKEARPSLNVIRPNQATNIRAHTVFFCLINARTCTQTGPDALATAWAPGRTAR